MESPTIARYVPQKSKKRVFPVGNSMDTDVNEISAPINRTSKSKSLKHKEVIPHEVIDVDMDEDCGNIMTVEGKYNTNNKGKGAMTSDSFGTADAANLGSVDGVHSSKKGRVPGSYDYIDLDCLDSDVSFVDDYMDNYYDDLVYDDYTILQSHFDNIDIPPGVEAPMPWLPGLATASSDQSVLHVQPSQVDFPLVSGASHSSYYAEPVRKRSALRSSSNVKTQVPAVMNLNKLDPPSAETTHSKKVPAAMSSSKYLGSKRHGAAANFKQSTVYGGTYDYSHDPLVVMGEYHEFEPPSEKYHFPSGSKKYVGISSLYSSPIPYMPTQAMSHTPGAHHFAPNWLNATESHVMGPPEIFPKDYLPHLRGGSPTTLANSSVPSGSSSVLRKDVNEDEIMRKHELFKKFDIVQDHSDHFFARNAYSMKQPPRSWAKKIQEEWKILEKDLPDTIFVRVYESRMDLLRAVIIGAEGTPYHDGLFFFDVFFPSTYPNVPPHVHYHSGGLRLNPNLYNCGKVCLSLLNTWSGNQKEKWIPKVSTMLQVLVSIQGLILNAKPYFNEPGFEFSSGTTQGEKSSLQYNENTFILSLKTMTYSLKRPPKHFEDFVLGHFFKRARDILVACKAYMDGAQVGCLVRGGVQDVDEGDKSCSQNFKCSLGGFFKTLVGVFEEVGIKDCEQYIPAAQMESIPKGNRLVSPALKAVNYFPS